MQYLRIYLVYITVGGRGNTDMNCLCKRDTWQARIFMTTGPFRLHDKFLDDPKPGQYTPVSPMPVRSTGGKRAVVYISLIVNTHHRQCTGIRCGCRWCARISWSSDPFRLHDSFQYSPNLPTFTPSTLVLCPSKVCAANERRWCF